MFVLRSIFWLTVAYIALHPPADLRHAADTLSAQALDASRQVIAQQLTQTECTDLQCQGGKAIAAAVPKPTPSSDSTMQDSTSTAPVPRPRPHWMG